MTGNGEKKNIRSWTEIKKSTEAGARTRLTYREGLGKSKEVVSSNNERL